PWLEALRDAIRAKFVNGETVVLACSALQKRYRDIIRSADPDYKAGEYSYCKVKFVCLVAPVGTIAERINKRSEKGNHFMPVSLLQSQMDLLQIFEYEGIPQIDSTM
ncbi:gluconokinase-like, partial [Dendrobium catenatum]|uniref:gluconokinase-like n=1 Tax=Dendrobium catenatum TaxID=906689 RepID=UPI00109F133D